MNLPLFIAGRYLFARKSHNVINIISAISVIGMAVGTAALIIFLSVYNGFDAIIRKSLSDLDPDYLITPARGKTFIPEGEAFDWAYDCPYVLNMSSVLQENVFVSYDGRQGVAKAKGVDSVYEEESGVRDYVRQGEFLLHNGTLPMAAVGSGFAYKMGISPNFLAPLEIWFPDREGSISLTNPMASVRSLKARPSCVFSINSDTDASLIILPLESMRSLLNRPDGVSGVEIRLVPDCTRRQKKEVLGTLQEKLGENFVVLDRIHQNESLYKMMKYEKASLFLILVFIIIIIGFNIFGSLSMLIIEKQEDIGTFRSMGATDPLIRRFFVLEGWMISLLGLAIGLVLGVALTLIQQKFGIIPMPGNYLVSSYPVQLKGSDVLVTSLSVAVIGYLIALIPVSTAFPKR
ncbi:MAG: FtsX-like permease family protein [Bacteroidales bacterium]|nr:FtsX-like permease family protein [Bacteroidales bacterium]